MKPDATQTRNQILYEEFHVGFGTADIVRLFNYINTWKTFVCVAAFFLIIDSFLFFYLG
jgi:hypothetical protein